MQVVSPSVANALMVSMLNLPAWLHARTVLMATSVIPIKLVRGSVLQLVDLAVQASTLMQARPLAQQFAQNAPKEKALKTMMHPLPVLTVMLVLMHMTKASKNAGLVPLVISQLLENLSAKRWLSMSIPIRYYHL